MDLDAMREGLTNPDENYRFTPGWGVQSGYSPNGESYGTGWPATPAPSQASMSVPG